MALDGTYGFVYCGTAGVGVGIFNLTGDQIIGCDYGGGRYTGTAIEDSTGSITVDATVHIAPAVLLVQGAAAHDISYSRRLRHLFPPLFGDGSPQQIDVSPGTVTVMVKRIADEFHDAAVDGFTLQTARRLG